MEEKLSRGELAKGYALLFFAGVGIYTVGKDVADMFSRYCAVKKVEKCTKIVEGLTEYIVEHRKEETEEAE